MPLINLPGTFPTEVGLLPTTAPTWGKSTSCVGGGAAGNCTLRAEGATGADAALPPWLEPLEPVGVLGDEEEGEVDCDEELAADWQQLLWYEESNGDRFLADGVVGELVPAEYYN